MSTRAAAKSVWLLIHKDLTRELRALHVLPGMLLLGLVLVFLLAMPIDLPAEQKTRLVGGLLWLAIFFPGTVALERSFTVERDAGCWQALMLYPVAPSLHFLAKMAVNLASLVILELTILPAFMVLADVSLVARPGLMALVAMLANVGYAAIGTLLSGLTVGFQRRGGLLALLLLPLIAPVILGAAQATSMLLAGEIDAVWWRWIQLLGTFAGLFTVIGALAFEFVVED